MALDPRSRERLEALGRRLPQPLPLPEPRPPRRGNAAAAPRHAVETEENPEQLFRELMEVSRDGTVPPHLLERLQQLEQQRRGRTSPADRSPGPAPAAAANAPTAGSGSGHPNSRPRKGQPAKSRGSRGRRGPASAEEEGLYAAFAQLLLEDEDLG